MARTFQTDHLIRRLTEIEQELHLRESRVAGCRRVLMDHALTGTVAGADAMQSFVLAVQDGSLLVDVYDALVKPNPACRRRLVSDVV